MSYNSVNGPCLKSSTTSNDWISFAGDVLFYSGIGYALILAIRRTWNEAMKRAKKQVEQLRQVEDAQKADSESGLTEA